MMHSAVYPFLRRRKLAAWLGIFAICLAVFMPLLTQGANTLAPVDATICSASHGAQTAPDHGTSQPRVHGIDSCGYCSLLTHTPFAPPGSGVALDLAQPATVMPPVAEAPLRLAIRHPRAQPRAPPQA